LRTATILPIVEEDQATGVVAEAYAEFREHFGRQDIPPILKCFATHPALLRQMMEVASALIFCEGHLSRRMKEMMATYISSLNACPYCVDSHAFFLHVHGGNDVLVDALSSGNLEEAPLQENERLLLEFVRKVSRESYKISAQDVESLCRGNWNNEEIAEAVHVAAMFACFNRVANAFGLPSQGLLGLRGETIPSEAEK
jgi:uncharacterized peroxidase-related enzyme